MEDKTWYEALSEHMNPVFTKEDFNNYRDFVLEELKHYRRYLKPGARVLDLGCGLGCTAVPLSSLGYRVVGIDNDLKVVEAAKQNAKNFGKDIEIIKGDIFELDKIFGKDSFDACISGGVLEHFKKNEIRKLVELQLKVAPLVIASMPVKTERTMKHYGITEKTALNNISDGIYRNFWSEDEWVNDVLKGFNIAEHLVARVNPVIGDFDEVFILITKDRIKKISA